MILPNMNDEVVDEDQLIKVITKELEIGIPPQYIGKEESAVNKLLRQRKLKYNPDLNGILLRFSNLEFLSDTGRIIDDGPMIFWTIRANFHIFNFHNEDQIVKSTVNRIGKKYIGCTLATCIDVTIKFDEECEYDIESQLVPSLSVGDIILFRVKSFIPSQRYIEGVIDAQVYSLWKQHQGFEVSN